MMTISLEFRLTVETTEASVGGSLELLGETARIAAAAVKADMRRLDNRRTAVTMTDAVIFAFGPNREKLCI